MANQKKNDDKPSKIVKFVITQNKSGKHISKPWQIILADSVEASNALQPVQTATSTAPTLLATQPHASASTATTSTTKITIKVEGTAPAVEAPAAKTFPNVAVSGQKVGKSKGGAKIFRNPRNLPRGSVSLLGLFLSSTLLTRKFRLALIGQSVLAVLSSCSAIISISTAARQRPVR
jgi:hypothetical protein